MPCAGLTDEHHMVLAGGSDRDDRCPLSNSLMPANDVRRAERAGLWAAGEKFQKRAGIFCREPVEEIQDAMPVLFGRFFDRHQTGRNPCAFQAAGAECDLGKNPYLPKKLLGSIVWGGHRGIVKKDEPLGG